MTRHIHLAGALTTILLVAACTDRPAATSPAGDVPVTLAPTPRSDASEARPERLAKLFARTLKNPAFRAYLKAQLDASPYREHKLAFQPFLAANGERGLRELALENGLTKDAVIQEGKNAIALEVYFPVPAHRAAWAGDDDVLVATAITDREAPVAFSPGGRRQLLDAATPPATPVLALVPVETDFTVPPARLTCLECDGGGGGGGGGGGSSPVPPPPGLYMTKSHFVQDFEGWLKGSPEFEVHILGQNGQTDSLISYQCAGEHAGGPYSFDQNNVDWSGTVLLFSKAQLDQYNGVHPGQNVRVFFVEDDDTACQIKTDPDRFQKLVTAVDNAYNRKTTGNDSSTAVLKAFKYGRAAYSIWQALAALIRSNDELVGNAVEDDIVGTSQDGYNWFVKGESNITNGWVNLVLY